MADAPRKSPWKLIRSLVPEVSQARAVDRMGRLSLTQRQQRLCHLWSSYCGTQYDARRIDWDGLEYESPLDKEAVASQGYKLNLPMRTGIKDDMGQSLGMASQIPLKYRRPSTPYPLVRIVVDRFTGLLFSERKHPTFRVPNLPKHETWLNSLAAKADFWTAMQDGRAYGGAVGTAIWRVGFDEGKPEYEVLDPLWVFPEWKNRRKLIPKLVEIRYQFQMDALTRGGKAEQQLMWFRRIIDEDRDVTYVPQPVKDGDEPLEWQEDPDNTVVHGLGFCPIVWVQNVKCVGDIDGEPDCIGPVRALGDSLDAVLSQSFRAICANLDPTLVIKTSEEQEEDLEKGNGAVLWLNPGDAAEYLVCDPKSIDAGMETADKLRAFALEGSATVADHPDATNRTATEVRHVGTTMYDRADRLRAQYGNGAVRGILYFVRAIRSMLQPAAAVDDQGREISVQRELNLGDLEMPDEGFIDQILKADVVCLWPAYVEPSQQDRLTAVQAASLATGGAKILDEEHASQFVAPLFDVEQPAAMAKQLAAEKDKNAQDFMDQAKDVLRRGNGARLPVPPPDQKGVKIQ